MDPHGDRNPTYGISLPHGYSGTDAADPFESWQELVKVADALGSLYPRGRALVIFVCATGIRYGVERESSGATSTSPCPTSTSCAPTPKA